MDGHADDINLWMCLRIAPRTADHRCRQVGDYESHTSPFLVGLRSVIDALCVDCIRVPALISPDRPSARATIGVHLVVVSHLECLFDSTQTQAWRKDEQENQRAIPSCITGKYRKKGYATDDVPSRASISFIEDAPRSELYWRKRAQYTPHLARVDRLSSLSGVGVA